MNMDDVGGEEWVRDENAALISALESRRDGYVHH